jgi:feruloyl-CoA synthase
VGEWLEHWAAATPSAPAFAERDPTGHWRRLSWAEARRQVGCLAQGLLDLKLKPGPVVILSDNALDHLLLVLATMHIGRAACSVSSAYSRLTRDHSKISAVLKTLRPALLYAADAGVYGPAVDASAGVDAPVVFSRGAEERPSSLSFRELVRTEERDAVADAFRAITPDTHAKYLLTSGSTGQPKVVINTHRMLCANQQMIAQVWRFLREEKPVLVDWLPWSHTFGANHNLNLALRNGGFFVIDEGRPAPGLIERTIDNVCDVGPTMYFNVPRGFDVLLPPLEADEAKAARFFARLRGLFYAGAALPQSTWERLQRLARRTRGEEIWLTTAWGSTETSPAVTSAHWKLDRAGVIGGVLPGLELKLVPSGEKQELRVRGPSVFPGYRDAPELTAKAFDQDGWYCIGDAGHLADETAPEQGIVFNGRVAEDFKLTTGTWVSVGTLRLRVIAAFAPYAQDAVITGHDRDEVGVLVFPSAQASGVPQEQLSKSIRAALIALQSERPRLVQDALFVRSS